MPWPFSKKDLSAVPHSTAATHVTSPLAARGEDLFTAAKTNNVSLVQELLAEGADVAAADSSGWRPVHWAARKNASAVMKILIAAGADFEAATSSGQRPLHWAARNRASAVAKILVDLEADLEAPDSSGQKPLHDAVCSGASATVTILIEAGANVNSTNHRGRTPLHLGAELGSVIAVQHLLGAGADPQLRDSNGNTPLQLARSKGRTAVATILEGGTFDFSPSRPPQPSPDNQPDNVADRAPSDEPPLSSQETIPELDPTVGPPIENPLTDPSETTSQSQSQSAESLGNDSEVSSQKLHIEPSQVSSTTTDSDSTCPSPEVTDEVRAVQNLQEDDIFAENYCIQAHSIFGKPMVRLAMSFLANQDVVLKFYDKPALYFRALSFYEKLNKSGYICKPIEKIKAHQGFPYCLAFEKGIHTLDEWLRIPDVGTVSKKEALHLVAVALRDLHNRGVVHCDVKPANLAFFPTDHRWKLLDIDSAVEVGVASEIITTIPYAAPEVLEAAEKERTALAVQPSTDMWAYGIIAFEVFTGRKFYEFEPTVKSVLEFLRSDRFKKRIGAIADETQRHFVKRFLKWDGSERRSAQKACDSSIFESATVTVSKALVGSHSSGGP